MLLSNTLQAVQNLLVDSSFFKVDPDSKYEIQVTPDERPFAYTGDNVVTIYGETIVRNSPEIENKRFDLTFSACVTKRVLKIPHDRQYEILYYDTLSSLSLIGELLLNFIDSNNSLLSSINSSIINQRNNTITILDNIDELGSEGVREYLSNSLLGAGVIGPIRGLQLTAKPIPRFADFFTAYSTRNRVQDPENTPLQPSGFSMIVTFKGPSIVLKTPC